jgi:DNA polymerase
MTTIVKSEVRPGSQIVLVGEAPGSQEVREGRPFVGPAGNLLNRCLAQAGLSRSEITVTNVIKVRPNNNDISVFIDLSKKHPIETAVYRESVEILKLELSQWKPNVVVACGAVPLYALTNKVGITKWRGSILESTLIKKLKVIPTIHPAAALRQSSFKFPIIFDLRRVKTESITPAIILPKRRYILEPTLAEVMLFCREHIKSPVAFDIEVTNKEVSCISYCSSPDLAISIPFVKENGHYWTAEEEETVWSEVKRIQEDKTILKVAQNAIFDITFLAEKCNILTNGLVGDTMIAFHHLYPDLPKNLGFISSVCTREPYYKYQLKESKGGVG